MDPIPLNRRIMCVIMEKMYTNSAKQQLYCREVFSMTSSIHDRTEFSAQRTELADMQFFQSSTHIRASTAPSRPLTDIQQFKLSKRFTQLQQTVVCSNQLLHSSFDKFDLDSPQGQQICQKYLQHIQNLCKTYNVNTADREYRSKFSQAYKVLYKQGQLSYLTEILDSAQQGFPYLWVNGQKYSFSQEVLDYGSKLMIEFFKLQHCLRDLYGKITQEPASVNIEIVINDIKSNLLEFDLSWSTFQKLYVMELMSIEVKARSLIAKAIEAEKDLTSVEIREKMKGKILLNCQDYLSIRSKLCEIIAQINHITNTVGKGRDDLDHSILCETQGIIRRVTRQQSKATRILAEKIRNSFTNIRMLLRKYDNNIQMVDPQLKNNADLLQHLIEYEKSWEKGANYFCDVEKKRYLLHFSGAIEGMSEKHPKFKGMIQFLDADIFIVVPSLLILKSLDKDDKNLCKYFLPNLNQIDTKIFRTYFELQKQFDQWKKSSAQHYHYYNILERMIVGEDFNKSEQTKYHTRKDLVDKIVSKIKLLGSQLHRYNPTEWNSFMEVCMAGVMPE